MVEPSRSRKGELPPLTLCPFVRDGRRRSSGAAISSITSRASSTLSPLARKPPLLSTCCLGRVRRRPAETLGCTVGNGRSLSMETHTGGKRNLRNRQWWPTGISTPTTSALPPALTQPRLVREERARSFAEIDLNISANLAMGEAKRCFNCGLCNQCDNCRLFCPDCRSSAIRPPRGATSITTTVKAAASAWWNVRAMPWCWKRKFDEKGLGRKPGRCRGRAVGPG